MKMTAWCQGEEEKMRKDETATCRSKVSDRVNYSSKKKRVAAQKQGLNCFFVSFRTSAGFLFAACASIVPTYGFDLTKRKSDHTTFGFGEPGRCAALGSAKTRKGVSIASLPLSLSPSLAAVTGPLYLTG